MVPEPREQGEQMEDNEIATLFAAAEDDYPTKFPLSYQEIKNRQKVDEEIKKLLRERSKQYKQTRFNFHWSRVMARLLSRKHSKNLDSNGITNYVCTQAKHVLTSLWASTLPGVACAKPWKTYAANANHVSYRSPRS
jgi:ABC-type ATPase with predicted acetyltransferase domain